MFTKKQIVLIISKNLLRGGIAIVAALIIVLFLDAQIEKIGDSLAAKRKLSFLLERRNETIASLRVDVARVGGTIGRVENALPPAFNILDFIGAMESLASQNSLQQSLRIGTPVPTPGLGEDRHIASIGYSVNLTGNVFTLVNYLKGFETLPYFSGITSLGISAQNPRGWEDVSSISFQANVYADLEKQ